MNKLVVLLAILILLAQPYVLQLSTTNGTPTKSTAPYLNSPSCLLDPFTEEVWLRAITGKLRIFYSLPSNYILVDPDTSESTLYYSIDMATPTNSTQVFHDYDATKWLHYAFTKAATSFKLYINAKKEGDWTSISPFCQGGESYIAICDSGPCTAQIRQYRRWDTLLVDADLLKLLGSTLCTYGTAKCSMLYEFNDNGPLHHDLSDGQDDIYYGSDVGSQVIAEESYSIEGGYSSASTVAKVVCINGNTLRAVFDADLLTDRISPTTPVEQSFEFWMYMGPYTYITDYDLNFPIIQSYFSAVSNANNLKVNCGLRSRKFSCYYFLQDNTTRIEIQQVEAVDVLMNKWAYISFQYREISDAKDNVILYIAMNDAFYSKTSANAPKNSNSATVYFNDTKCTSSDLYFYFQRVSIWSQLRAKANILRMLNKNINPVDHRLLTYYSQFSDNRGVQNNQYILCNDINAFSGQASNDFQDIGGMRIANIAKYSISSVPLTLCNIGYDYVKETKKCMTNGKRIPVFTGTRIHESVIGTLTGTVTIEGWLYITDVSNGIGLFSLYNAGSSKAHIVVNPARNLAMISGTSSKTVPIKTWAYMQFVYTDVLEKGYVNGIEYVSFSHAALFAATSVSLRLGLSSGGGYSMYGALYQVRVWMGNKYINSIKET